MGTDTSDQVLLPDNPALSATSVERIWNRIRNYGFSAGGWNFVLHASLYSELLPQPKIAPLPNSPPYFRGLANVRSNLVPIFDVRTWLDAELVAADASAAVTEGTYAILLGDLKNGAALMIDGKPRAVDLANYRKLPEIPNQVPQQLAQSLSAAYGSGSDLWLMIDHQKLFSQLSRASE